MIHYFWTKVSDEIQTVNRVYHSHAEWRYALVQQKKSDFPNNLIYKQLEVSQFKEIKKDGYILT